MVYDNLQYGCGVAACVACVHCFLVDRRPSTVDRRRSNVQRLTSQIYRRTKNPITPITPIRSLPIKKDPTDLVESFFCWCPGQESNLHALRHTHLKRARLPIPPPGLPSALRVSLPFVERAKIHIKLKKQKFFLKFSRSTKPPSTLCSRLLEFAKSEN